jgi:hypothetical protein
MTRIASSFFTPGVTKRVVSPLAALSFALPPNAGSSSSANELLGA